MTQENNRILVLEEAVAGLLRRVRGLESRVAELESGRRRTSLLQERKDRDPPVRDRHAPGRTSPRPYTWAELGKAQKPLT